MPETHCAGSQPEPYYLLGVLNARYASFYLKKKFDSLKVLKRHLEMLPYPRVSEPVEASIIHAVKSILRGEEVSEHRRRVDSLLEDALGCRFAKLRSTFSILLKAHGFGTFSTSLIPACNLANWRKFNTNLYIPLRVNLDAADLKALLQAASAQICVNVEGGWCRHRSCSGSIRRSPPFQEVCVLRVKETHITERGVYCDTVRSTGAEQELSARQCDRP